MLKRARFDMTNPEFFPSSSGEWKFWLAADDHIYDLVSRFDCVSWFHYEEVWGRAWVTISPLYDYETAWLWIYEQLEVETSEVDLGDVWGET